MTTKLAAPTTVDEKPLAAQEPPPSRGALAEALRRLGMNPEAVLERAILGEIFLRDLQPREIERQTGLPAWRFIPGPLRPLEDSERLWRERFLEPEAPKRLGRKRSEIAGVFRDEDALARHGYTLGGIRAVHRRAPKSARTAEELRVALGLTWDLWGPELEAVAAYRLARERRVVGSPTFEARAAMLVFGEPDSDAALGRLRKARAAVGRRKRTTK